MAQDVSGTAGSFWKQSASVARAIRPSGLASERRRALLVLFTYEVLCLTFLQKLAIPFAGGQVQAILPLTYVFILGLFFVSRPKLDLARLILMVAFLISALVSVLLLKSTYSANSIILLMAIYIPFIFYVEVGRSTYQKFLKIYLNVIMALCFLILLQHALQFIWSWKVWPNLDTIIDQNYNFQGYVYIQPIIYGSKFMKPNGIFMLEVSFVSQFIAIAIALELVFFQRITRLLIYSLALISTFAGTGLLLLAICAPVLLGRVNLRTLGGVIVIVFACILLANRIQWYQQVEHRFGEFRQQGGSANHRFIEPVDILFEVAQRPASAITGLGPGSGEKGRSAFWWVSTKLAYEYGFLSTLTFLAFFGYTLFRNAPSQRIATLLFVMYNIMSGFIIPVYPFLIFLLGGLFRIRSSENAE